MILVNKKLLIKTVTLLLFLSLLFTPLFFAFASEKTQKSPAGVGHVFFGGHEYDSDTQLSYMNARYYDSEIGRFVSQDPAYLLIGDQSFKDKYQRTLEMHLSDPQSLNSYSYVNNNPLRWTDPDGEILPFLALAGAVAWAVAEVSFSAYDAYDTATTLSNPNASFTDKGLSAGGFVAGLALPGGGYGKGAKEVVKNISKAESIVGKGIEMIKGGKDAFLRAAEHSDARNHYPGKSVQEIENIAKDAYKNFDIKVNVKGEKQYYYNSKTNGKIKGVRYLFLVSKI